MLKSYFFSMVCIHHMPFAFFHSPQSNPNQQVRDENKIWKVSLGHFNFNNFLSFFSQLLFLALPKAKVPL